MKKKLFLVIIIILGSLILIQLIKKSETPSSPPQNITQVKSDNSIQIIAQNLDTPWGIVSLPDKSILVTERPGRVRLIDTEGVLDPNPVKVLEGAREIGEGGLLGITIHPNFPDNNFVYLYYTYSSNQDDTLNRVVRFKYQDQQLKNEQIIIDNIPGALNHNGGRIKFGPDNFLYITTGDAQNPSLAQDINSLAGKILRATDEGKPAPGNPFNNLVYSYGHRNSQGLAWDRKGQLWATEHGRSGIQSGLDEVNLIEKGRNYGWPVIQGNEKREGMMTPYLNSGSTTWAPAGAAIFENSLFFGGLRGQSLYQLSLEGNQQNIKAHFQGKYGRIRDVVLGPDNMIYITTSNNDGRGNPKPYDDKIIKIDPKNLR